MSDLAPMGATEARERVDRVKTAVTQARADLVALWRDRAWLALGYQSWDDLCDAEFGVRMALPRDERPAVVADLRGQGMTTRAIGSALGVSKDTVARDLAGVSDETPAAVVGLDGKSYAAARSAPAERYPELAHYADRPAKAEALASALDGYDPTERDVRRNALAATIAAETRTGGPLPGVVRDPDRDKADDLYDLVSRAARAIETADAAGLLTRIADRLDDITRTAWAGTYSDLADRAADMTAALTRTNLRSVQ